MPPVLALLLYVIHTGSAHGLSLSNPDPAVLAWNNTDPQPGETVDGTLTVLLDPTHLNIETGGPALKLAVRARLADVQPAPLGPLLFHCGGPGSTRSCMSRVASRMDPDIKRNFDLWGIDQRGIGDSTPAIACSGAMLPPTGKNSYAVSDFSTCACAFPDGSALTGECFADIDPEDGDAVLHLHQNAALRAQRCYASERFKLQDPATNATYNLLDWIGSQSLAYDIDAFRTAIGAPSMSIFGFSYGTEVGAVYASLYPDFVDRLVINGNMNSRPSSYDVAAGGAGAQASVLAKLFSVCAVQPKCPIADAPNDHLTHLLLLIRSDDGVTADAGNSWPPFRLSPGLLFAYFSNRLADSSGESWWQIPDMIARLNAPETRASATAELLDEFCVVRGVKPVDAQLMTWSTYGVCVGAGQLAESVGGDPFLSQTAVLGLDSVGRFLPEQAVRRVADVRRSFGSVGAGSFVGCFSGFSGWVPEAAPPAPFGSSNVQALVVGNLHDPSTNYEWSQMMHRSFPNGALMTWQGVGHCLSMHPDQPGSAGCNKLVERYLMTKKLPPNGHTCHTSFEPKLWIGDDRSDDANEGIEANDKLIGTTVQPTNCDVPYLLPTTRRRPTYHSRFG